MVTRKDHINEAAQPMGIKNTTIFTFASVKIAVYCMYVLKNEPVTQIVSAFGQNAYAFDLLAFMKSMMKAIRRYPTKSPTKTLMSRIVLSLSNFK